MLNKLANTLCYIGKTFTEVIMEATVKAIGMKRDREYKPGEEREAATKKEDKNATNKGKTKKRETKEDETNEDETKQSQLYHPLLEPMFNNGSLFAVTLASNCERMAWFYNSADSKKAKMASALKRLDRLTQQDLIGRHFNKPHNYDKRWEGFFLFERPNGNIHLHGVLWTDGCGEHFVEEYLSYYWKKVMPSGTVKVVPITDMDGWLYYSTKYYREDGIKALKADDILFMPAVPAKDREPA